MAPTNVETVHQTSSLHFESNLDRLGLLSPTPRPAFPETKRANHAPICFDFDQQPQVSQGHTSYNNKKSWNTEVHGGGGLGLLKPARDVMEFFNSQ